MEEARQHPSLSGHPDARSFATERLLEGEAALAGRGLVRAFHAEERFTEAGLIALMRRSTWHYSAAYWVSALAGVAVLLRVLRA